MKLEMTSQHLSNEQMPVRDSGGAEHAASKPNIESIIISSPERYGQNSNNSSSISDVNMTTVLPTPVRISSIVDDRTTIGSTPLVANDDDLIEKEWVDKAKKIVEDTRDDPYRREKSVNKLQIDYLKKRYGRELGVAE
jgi:hypothetical protein